MLLKLLAITGFVAASPVCSSAIPNVAGFDDAVVRPSRGGGAVCVSGKISLTASATNLKLNFPLPQNQSQVSGTIVDIIAAGSTTIQQAIIGRQNVSGTYDIGASLCMPVNCTVKTAVQILTHGIGFDRHYWDFRPGYSYVDYAAQQGYATFLYDRLGVGKSAKPDPIAEVQSPLELRILAQLIAQLRMGKLGGQAFQQVIGVGHSYGSVLTQGVTSALPQLLDAAVLTGFSINSTGSAAFLAANNLAIASQDAPYRFADLNNGYLVTGNAIANQLAFFKAPNFDPDVLAAVDARKQPITFGELLTLTAPINLAEKFTGPVAIVNGANDLPFCDGNCSIPIDQLRITRAALYPAAKNVTTAQPTLAVPLTGHGLNLHYSANTAYEFIHKYLNAAGL